MEQWMDPRDYTRIIRPINDHDNFIITASILTTSTEIQSLSYPN